MTNNEVIEVLEKEESYMLSHGGDRQAKALRIAIDKIEQEPSRGMEEIKEVINCDADAETKCKMISNILTAKPHYFEEPFINKPCVSSEVCEHDKQKVLDKIRAEIVDLGRRTMNDNRASGIWACRDIIDKYKVESEGEEWQGVNL